MQGENARMSSFVGAIAIADLVKTTLGPKGMDKILQSVRTHPVRHRAWRLAAAPARYLKWNTRGVCMCVCVRVCVRV
ncbi:hypothetical protein EON66_05300 [archaeon]|nr:MAG: hypothetical protein EON66_05300 [archaeon]